MNNGLADMLCSLSGQGAATNYESYTDGQGTVLTPQSKSVTSIVPGYHVSVGFCNSALINCTSYEFGTTIFDDSRLQKILHGRDAVLGQLPWHIALYRSRLYHCGGSIIHPNWILTAAHCIVDGITYIERVGAIEVEEYIPDIKQNYFYTSSQSRIHPSYKAEENGIGLVYLSQPIVFNDYVRTICIASRKTAEAMLNAGHNAECYISGWGRYHNLINKVRVYPKDECNQIYQTRYGEHPQDITVCVDNRNFESPSCNSDSGGPLICGNNHGRFELLGTFSWGYESCFQDGYPDVFQVSYAHKSWIETVTGLNCSDLTMDND